MEKAVVVTLLLCIYGSLKEIRPSESFLTEYLQGPWVNLTDAEVNHQVYPVWTYSYLGLLIPVFLLTDLLRYKPVIVIEGISYVATWCLLLWAKGVISMQIMEFFYGIATSTEVAYYTYIYAVVSDDVYKKVTSFTRAAVLFGRFLSGVMSQVLVSTNVMNYHQLNFISLGFVSAALMIALLLPSAPSSVYFNKTDESKAEKRTFKAVLGIIASELKTVYKSSTILKWSLWWAFATCGNLQVGNYIQPLWESVYPSWKNSTSSAEGEKIYNGAVEATYTALGAAAAFGVGYINFRWEKCGEIILGIVTAIQSVSLIVMSMTENIWVCYVGYIIFRVTYQGLITIVSYQVAKDIPKDSYGLIFGCNTFTALLLQTIMTSVLVTKGGFELNPRQQFLLYGLYFGLLAVAFMILGAKYLFNRFRVQTISGENHTEREEIVEQ